MISSRILPLAVFLSIAIFNVSARAQNTKNDEAAAALREKAYALLESVAGQLGTLQSACAPKPDDQSVRRFLTRDFENAQNEML